MASEGTASDLGGAPPCIAEPHCRERPLQGPPGLGSKRTQIRRRQRLAGLRKLRRELEAQRPGLAAAAAPATPERRRKRPASESPEKRGRVSTESQGIAEHKQTEKNYDGRVVGRADSTEGAKSEDEELVDDGGQSEGEELTSEDGEYLDEDAANEERGPATGHEDGDPLVGGRMLDVVYDIVAAKREAGIGPEEVYDRVGRAVFKSIEMWAEVRVFERRHGKLRCLAGAVGELGQARGCDEG